ncbi:MAG: VCBS repeat-containing protein [Ferruginibacter sp.]
MIATTQHRRWKKLMTILVIICLPVLLTTGCKTKTAAGIEGLHFTLLAANETNIDFNNKITESDSVNVYDNEYMYNGSGVGVGDFNNDGLQDIFFGGSMVSSKLYINKGNFKFEDITVKAGLQTSKWCTGISVVDINNDGFLDIYICSSHSPDKEKRKNLLFINDGKLHFTEQAASYGLADTGFSTQAAFFDYDKDGDLDMYLLNHRLYNIENNNLSVKDTSGNSPAEDRLYRNDGILAGQSHPVFNDVTRQAGIKEDGYGLGIVVTDVNNDNLPDIYVANDYIGNDLLWLNKGDGSFANIISTSLKHQSYNSMGVDASDINNDGLPDIAVLDMSPEYNERKKMMFNASSQEKYDMQQRLGYEPAFVRNMLQLNNGLKKNGNRVEPFYSEIGQLAGISETDWSWSVLMADFDNDGWKDIHITNGLAKDVTNNDYATFRNSNTENNYTFGDNKVAHRMDKATVALLRKNLDQYGSIKIDGYFYRNNGNLGFENMTEQAGLAVPSISNGAAYVDLDNDGDLDLVVNNMNQEAFVWKNELRKSVSDSTNNFITIQLKGNTLNINGLGSKLSLFVKGEKQFLEQSPVRGYSSSIDYRLHFGIGNAFVVDSIKIQWPDNKIQVLRNIKANEVLTIKQEDASPLAEQEKDGITTTIFTDISGEANIQFRHTESQYFDYGAQRGVPQKYSQLGPCIATADVNGDGLKDFFIGGASHQAGKLFIQNKTGDFDAKDIVPGSKTEEDLGAVFFDADGDKDQDLLITGGSAEFGTSTMYNQPRLYINDGKGNFIKDTVALPKDLNSISSCVTVSDYDGDGDMDIFIGGRVLPQKYPQSPRSYILQNNNGKFLDVTKVVCPALEFAGLITGAVFTDINNDKMPDLVICGEWMPVRFFENMNGKFEELTTRTGLQKMNGQWRSLEATDVDKDGDIDFIVGNLGNNNKYHIAPDRPLKLFTGDFDNNHFSDIIPAYYIKNNKRQYELFPALDRTQLADQIPSIKKTYLLSADYAKANMNELINAIPAKDMKEFVCETTTSVWLENVGNGQFKQHPLPIEAQFAPVNSIIAKDIDGDGNMDILLAGNEYQEEAITGRYDASYGLFLKGNGKGGFTKTTPVKSGFIIDGDVKGMISVKTKKGELIIAAVNDAAVKCFKVNRK